MRSLTLPILALLLLGFAAPLSAQTSDSSSGPCTHIVRSGENLFRISLNYGVSMNDVVVLNRIADPRRIYPGQQLLIPSVTCGYAGTTAPGGSGSSGSASGSLTGDIYTVASGDTLARIAQRFGVSVSDLIIANNITNSSLIHAGQKLIIPSAGVSGCVTNCTTPNPQATPAPALNCGPGSHQVNCWPTYGGQWAQDSIANEPIITVWESCTPEVINGSLPGICSKTGLGYFPLQPPNLPSGWSLVGNQLAISDPNVLTLDDVLSNSGWGYLTLYLKSVGYSEVIVIITDGVNSGTFPVGL